MIVYHGSYCRVERPELTFSREKLDFGKGFYITPIREQAERWSKRFLRARKAAILNVYELDENLLKSSGFKVKHLLPMMKNGWILYSLAGREKLFIYNTM